MAQDAAFAEAANSKLRRLSAYNKSFKCADIKIGDSKLLCEAANRKSAPRWRGPARMLDA